MKPLAGQNVRVFAGTAARIASIAGCLAFWTAAAHAEGPSAACAGAEAPISFEPGAVKAIHVYTGADGVSHLRAMTVKGFSVPFFKTGKTLYQTVLGPAAKVALVQGPSSESIPVRAGIGRVMFLTLRGSSTVVLPNGEEMTATPGMLTIFDDTASRTGHGGRTGPCGYTALSIAIADGAPTFAEQK